MKRRVIDFDEKRHAVWQFYMTKDKGYLASLVMALFTPKDVKEEYKNLPKKFKV